MSWFVQTYVSAYVFFFNLLDGFDPRTWADWLQLISIPIGLLWIAYQFNRLRGRSARAFDKWVQEQTTRMRKNLMDERTRIIEQVRNDAHRPMWKRTALVLIARLKLILQFAARILLLRRWTPSVDYAMTLWRAGRKEKARMHLLQIGAEIKARLPTYAELEAAKHLEARNAFLFAGLAADEIPQAAEAFRATLALSKDNDVDAHKLLARQILDGPHPTDALRHCDRVVELGRELRDEAVTSDGFRLQAEVAGIRTQHGRQLLMDSLRLDDSRKNYRGVGRTQELLGDVYAKRAGNKRAAANWYRKSLQNYEWSNDWVSVQQVEQKLGRIVGTDTIISRVLDQLSLAIQELATKTRGRPRM